MEYVGLFVLWISVLYLVPFVYVRILNSVHVYDFHGVVLLMIPTTIIFPILFYSISGNPLPFGSHLFVPPLIIVLLLWYFFADSLDLADNFLSSVIIIYVPATVAMLLLLLIGVFEFSLSLVLPFTAPVAAYYFFKHLGYITSCILFISYMLFDLWGALIVSGVSAAGIILYKLRFRRIEEFDDISIEETIHTGMPVLSHTGFSKVKDYSEIPNEAIDPYTLKNIHDLIIQGKEIVKCNSCGTYYDKEVLRFYKNNCAVFGCSNSLT